jgi:hypothetical protein
MGGRHCRSRTVAASKLRLASRQMCGVSDSASDVAARTRQRSSARKRGVSLVIGASALRSQRHRARPGAAVARAPKLPEHPLSAAPLGQIAGIRATLHTSCAGPRCETRTYRRRCRMCRIHLDRLFGRHRTSERCRTCRRSSSRLARTPLVQTSVASNQASPPPSTLRASTFLRGPLVPWRNTPQQRARQTQASHAGRASRRAREVAPPAGSPRW